LRSASPALQISSAAAAPVESADFAFLRDLIVGSVPVDLVLPEFVDREVGLVVDGFEAVALEFVVEHGFAV